MCSRFSSRAPAAHLASTDGRLRDQPRLHRCNHSTYTSRSAFSAVVCPGGARIVVVSSPPSDPSGGRGDALKARPPRAAPDESGLSGRPGAAYNRPGRLPSDAAPWQVRWRPPPSNTVAELRGPSLAVRRTETPRRNGQRAAPQVHAAYPGGWDDRAGSRHGCSRVVATLETREVKVPGFWAHSLPRRLSPPRGGR